MTTDRGGSIPHMTPDQFRALGHRVVDFLASYMERVEDFPVLSPARPGDVAAALPPHAPEEGLPSWDPVFGDLERIILPGLTHWQSPNFFAFFPCNASGPAILGELLSAGLNVNGMLWATSPAATELETRVLDWLRELIGLPEEFLSTSAAGGGVIQGTASESTLIAMLAARHRAWHGLPAREAAPQPEPPVSAGSMSRKPIPRLVAYASTQAHSSVIKAAMIAGIASSQDDREHIRLIDTDDTHAMRPEALAAAIREDIAAGRTPFYVCATVGTTSSTAVDPIDRIAEAIRGTGCWLHVDAAHAGAACICPEHRWMLRGIEAADSICFNPHKWLLTNFDCDCFWTRDRRALVSALSITPEYLRNAASQAGAVIDYRDWQIPLGRRFRALKLWLVIRHYGAEGLRAYIREHVRIAGVFEGLVREDPRFEIAAPRTVNLVCFRLRGPDALNRALMDRLNATGRIYLTHTSLNTPAGPRFTLRMAVGSTTTQERHIRAAWDLIRREADAVAAEMRPA